MLLEGIFLPLTTPFHADGRLFLHKLAVNVEHYSRTQAAGMLVLVREGEGDSLTDEETIQVLRSAIAAAADEKVMIANVGRQSVWATLKLAEEAASAGYDAVAIRPPWNWRADMEDETGFYFQTIADRSPLPVVVVSDLNYSIWTDVTARLASHPQIIGAIHSERSVTPERHYVPQEGHPAREDRPPHERLAKLMELAEGVSREVTVTATFTAVTNRMARHAAPSTNFVSASSLSGTATVAVPIAPALKTRTKKVGFQVLAGSTRTMLDTWRLGASGAVPRLAACAPQACCEVWQAYKDGDAALAAEKQERIQEAAELVEGRGHLTERRLHFRGLPALKYGCDLNSYFGGVPRLPLLPLTADQRFEVERILAGIKN